MYVHLSLTGPFSYSETKSFATIDEIIHRLIGHNHRPAYNADRRETGKTHDQDQGTRDQALADPPRSAPQENRLLPTMLCTYKQLR